MNGKQKCRILKQIRQQIAEANDIDLVIAECTHKGECRGTCPRCEAEVRYLEQQLERRRSLQKRVALVGVSAGMTLALSGCQAVDAVTQTLFPGPEPTPEEIELMGDVPYYIDDPGDEVLELDGEVALDDRVDPEPTATPDPGEIPDPIDDFTTTGLIAPMDMADLGGTSD
ncbi:MAG: hypothetical protein IJJ45_09085 [Clostridia bacterium]|nr:hypothetical protein [Clostridia bacterium]